MIGAVFGLGSGILSIIVAIVLPVITPWLAASDSVSFLKGISSVLLILFLPLLILGAHCLDLLEKKSGDFPAAELQSGNFKPQLKLQYAKNRDTLNHGLVFFWLVGSLTLFLPFGGRAQQAVFNVPTSDVLNKGKVYVELDAGFKTNNQDALRKFSSFVPRIVVGAGVRVEFGLNVIGNLNPGADTTTLVPTVKWKFYQNEKNDFWMRKRPPE